VQRTGLGDILAARHLEKRIRNGGRSVRAAGACPNQRQIAARQRHNRREKLCGHCCLPGTGRVRERRSQAMKR